MGRILFLGMLTVFALAIVRCGAGSSGAKIRFVSGSGSNASMRRWAAGDIGHNTAAEIQSLQYYVTRIQICESLQITGSGYQNADNCATLFGNEDAGNAYETFKVAQAEQDTSSNWIDIVSTTTVAATNVSAGTYRFGIVEIRKPIKLNARLVVPNGDVTIKTCKGGSVSEIGSGLDFKEVVTVPNMTSCTQELATIGGSGGGHWFAFQSPVVIESGKEYTLDLNSNPVAAVTGGSAALLGDETYTDGTYGVKPPDISLVPVLRDSDTQKSVREQYEISGMAGVDGKLVVDLYFAGTASEVGSGEIVGAGTRFIHDENASKVAEVYNPYSVVINSDGTLRINDYEGKATVDGLTRSTSSAAGSVGTVTVDKGMFHHFGSGTVSGNATFIGVTEL